VTAPGGPRGNEFDYAADFADGNEFDYAADFADAEGHKVVSPMQWLPSDQGH
jgi:hypothetical protein